MTRQVLNLSGLHAESGWQGAEAVDSALIEGGAAAYLRYIGRVGNSIRVRLSATETGDPAAGGPEFTDALETAEAAFTFAAADGSSLVLKGPGHAGNAFADPTEPYFWTPDNGAQMNAWLGNRSGDFTLTLSDGLPDVAVHALRGAAAAGGAETVARIAVVPALTLSDFDAEGLELDVLALIRAGDGGGGTLYAAPPRGNVGALLAGELGLGETETAITRLRRRNGTMLALNDNDPLQLADYFGAGGAGADLTLHIQTLDGVASLPVATHGVSGGNYIQFGPLGSDLLSLVDDIAAGERFIFALARPARAVVAVRSEVAAGESEVAARLLRVTLDVRAVRGRASAGAAEVRARQRVRRARIVRGTAAGGAVEAAAHVQAIRQLRGVAVAGEALATGRAALVGVRAIRGRARAGLPIVLVRLQPVAAGALYDRALRESAPADRLLTALEIGHPAMALPVRVINDTVGRRIEGNDYVALRFDARLADDVAGQAPQAELGIDNIGRELTQWIEATGGGIGATVRVMLVLDIPDLPVEWEVTLDVAGMAVDQERVTARLGFDPLLGGAAVTLRHDPQISPGLF